MKIKAYQTFRNFYRSLPKPIRKKVRRQIRILARNPRHPSLQCKKVQGTHGIYEARIDLQYRMTFEVMGDTIYLRVVGSHDKVLKAP